MSQLFKTVSAMYPSSPHSAKGMDLYSTAPSPQQMAIDARAQARREADEREIDRLEKLSTQRSPHRPPEERIRIWESLHGLRLPRTAGHKLVTVIAEQTELPVAAVEAEQLRRHAGAGTG